MNETTEMMYDANEAVRKLNTVEGFEPKHYLREEHGEEGISFYLDTKYRLLWFRLKYPTGKIIKIPKMLAKDYATFEVRIYADVHDAPDNFLANGFASRYRDDENKVFGLNFVESAETAALGRALKDAGFGTQFCDIALPNDAQIVDAGVDLTLDQDEDGVPTGIEENTAEREQESVGSEMTETVTSVKRAAAPKVEKKEKKLAQLTADMPVSELQKHMTLEFAKIVKIQSGWDTGKTLGELAISKPKSVEFHASRGENNLVKVAAQFLLNEAKKTA